jgi:hypothetical protein
MAKDLSDSGSQDCTRMGRIIWNEDSNRINHLASKEQSDALQNFGFTGCLTD